jgi:hypothetical protein
MTHEDGQDKKNDGADNTDQEGYGCHVDDKMLLGYRSKDFVELRT